MSCVSTGMAGEQRLRDTVFLVCIPTLFATIRRMPGINLVIRASSIFRFGSQYRDELPPGSVTNASVQAALGCGTVGQEPAWLMQVGYRLCAAQHVGYVEVFDSDQVIVGYQFMGPLVMEIATLVGNLPMPCRQCLPCFSAVVRAALLANQSALRAAQLVACDAGPERVADVTTIRCGGKTGNPYIDANDFPSGWQRIVGHFVTRQDQHPAPPLAAYLDRLNLAAHRAMHGHLNLANALQVDAVGVGMPAGTIAVFGPFRALETALGLESGNPGFAPAFTRRKKPSNARFRRRSVACSARKRPDRDIRAFRADIGELSPTDRRSRRAFGSPARRRDVPAMPRCKPSRWALMHAASAMCWRAVGRNRNS